MTVSSQSKTLLTHVIPAKRKPNVAFQDSEDEAEVHTATSAAASRTWKEKPKFMFTNFNEAAKKATSYTVLVAEEVEHFNFRKTSLKDQTLLAVLPVRVPLPPPRPHPHCAS